MKQEIIPAKWKHKLSKALREADGNTELLCANPVCDALSGFLQYLRERDSRSDGGSKFTRDDSIVLVRATNVSGCLELSGYIWWISQQVEPIWARFHMDKPKEQVIAYSIKCGIARTELVKDMRDLSECTGQKYLRRVLEGTGPEEIENAWFSGQLTHDLRIWFFEFASESVEEIVAHS